MRHAHVQKLVFLSSVSMLVALGLMVLSLVSPKPIYLVVAMSVGQGIGMLAVAMYLLAIALDLQKAPSAAPASNEAAGAPQEATNDSKPSP